MKVMKGLRGFEKMEQEEGCFFSPSADMTVISMSEGSILLVDIIRKDVSSCNLCNLSELFSLLQC